MFSILGCIVVGDKTSCGGTVVSGSMTDDIDGKPISRVGDQVSCRHSCKIMTGDNAWIIAGQPVAIHGSLTTRQCTCISAAHNNHAGVGQTQAQQDAVPKAADSGIAFAPVMQGIEQEVHWLEFSLKNKSGMPFSGEAYLVTDSRGVRYEGALDESGYARLDSVAPGVCKVVFPDLVYSADVQSCQTK